MLPIRTILVPTDFSELCQPALELACELCKGYGARLLLLHVLRPQVMALGGTQALPPIPDDAAQREATAKLQAARPALGAILVERMVREGNEAEVILRVAQEVPCDLIVMGTHGRSGLGRLLVGSVAEAVLRKAPCPVLTVKAPLAQGQSAPAA
jgi:nucleotide-binding universal stress UspA family protein